MTRFAGRIVFAFVSSIAAGGAQAADPAVSAYADRCGGSEIVTAPYKEQICYAGAHGYAACRWVQREYSVRVPAECPRLEEVEDAYKIPRRPMTGHGRGLVAKS